MISKTLVAALLAAATLSGTAHAATPGLYYASGSTIGRASLDGTGATPLVSTPTTTGIAVDGDALYYTATANPGSIGRVGTDGSALDTTLITGLVRPFQLAVSGGKLYWSDYGGSGTIGRANLDGSSPELLLIGLSSPTGLAVAGGHIYWSTAANANHYVSRANLDGTGANATWLDAGTHVGPMTTDGGYLYWIDNGGLSRAALDGSGLESGIGPGLASGMSMAVGDGHAFSSLMGVGRIGLDGTGLDPAFLLSGTFVNGVAVVPAPAVAPVPGTLDTSIGAATKLALHSTGAAPLRVTGATLSGADAADFSVALGTCASPVAPGDSCELEVTFAPVATTAGARAASVEVTFGDGVAPLTVGVAGTVAATPPVSPVPPVPPVDTTAPAAPSTPAPAACRSVRTLSFHLRKPARGARYSRVDVLFGGKRVKRITRPGRVFSVDLAGQPEGSATVKITSTNARGRTSTRTRTFRTCTPGH